MSPVLRVELVILAIIFVAIVFTSVNKRKLWLQYSLIWIIISVCMIVIAIFPNIVIRLTQLVGIETPSNLIYLLGIMALLILTFWLTVIVSKQATKIKTLTQMVSIERYIERKKMEELQINQTEKVEDHDKN